MSASSNQCPHCQAPLRLNAGRCRRCRRLVVVSGRYRIVAPLSSGNHGTVYLAQDSAAGLYVAVKQMAAHTEAHYRQIESEVAVLRERLSGLRCVPRIYGAYQDGAEVYIVMEYIEGLTLDRAGVLPWPAPRVEAFLAAMLEQLDQVHQRGVVHRDIKPQNIIRTSQGAYVLIDFGIAKQGAATRTIAHGLGTPRYAPLEQFRGQTTTPQSDLYALGVTAYELLTGELPPEAIERLSPDSPLLPPAAYVPDVPRRLEDTLLAMLQLDPQLRPPSAAMALLLLRDPPPLIQPPPPAASPARPNLLGCLGVAALAAVAALALFGRGGTAPRAAPSAPPAAAVAGVPSGRLVFSSRRDDTYELYLADAGGGAPWNISRSADEHEYAPSWSGDGRYIAYVAQVGREYAIARLDLPGLERTRLTPLTPGVNYGTPVVSPDGALIAYNAGPEGNYDLYVMRPDGGGRRLVAAGAGTDFHPGWLPDGRRLVYVARGPAGDSLMLASVEGVALGALFSTAEELRTPAVSPDGAHIAFAMGRSGSWKLYVMPMGGGPPRRVTAEPGAESYPAWSADGASLMFMSTRDDPQGERAQLYLVDLDGRSLRRVFDDGPDDRQPAWRP